MRCADEACKRFHAVCAYARGLSVGLPLEHVAKRNPRPPRRAGMLPSDA
jgi:hypothetical protein